MPWTKANIASWVVNLAERRMAYAGADSNDFDSF
jgi:uncharacterized protein YbcV (DUF1398 family)